MQLCKLGPISKALILHPNIKYRVTYSNRRLRASIVDCKPSIQSHNSPHCERNPLGIAQAAFL